MKKLLLFVFATICIIANASAQDNRQAVEIKSKALEKTRGAINPNIVIDVTNVDVITTNPLEENSSSNSICEVTFNNGTGYQVKVYIDGKYKGTVDAWAKTIVNASKDYTTVYCMSIGGTLEWLAKATPNSTHTYILK